MAADVDIANLALLELGDATISALTEASSRADACNRLYAPTRDMVLRSHPWKFATKWANLNALAADATWVTVNGVSQPNWEWGKAYALPSDLLRILKTDLQTSPVWSEAVNLPVVWKVGIANGVKALLTNDPSVNLKYIARVTDPNLFDALFVDCFAARLAHKLALTLTGKRPYAQEMWQLYLQRKQEAAFVDSTEGSTEDITPDDFIIVR